MFQRHFTFKDEPWATAAACALFMSAALIPLLIPRPLANSFGPVWLRLCMPFLLVIAGIPLLRRLRAIDTIRSILVVGLTAAAVFVVWGGVTAVTGYTIARGNPYPVPRSVSLNYFYIALVISPIIVSAASCYQKRLREIDGA